MCFQGFFISYLWARNTCGRNEPVCVFGKISKIMKIRNICCMNETHLSLLHPRVPTLHWIKWHDCSVSTFDIALHRFNRKLWHQYKYKHDENPRRWKVLWWIVSNILFIKYIKEKVYQVSDISRSSFARNWDSVFYI